MKNVALPLLVSAMTMVGVIGCGGGTVAVSAKGPNGMTVGVTEGAPAVAVAPPPVAVAPAPVVLTGLPLAGAQLDVVGDIEFDTASATIRATPQNATVLNILLEAGKRYTMITRLRIEGHTDSDGNEAANLDLSLRRAEAVKAWLVERGIDPRRLVTAGCASRDPLYPNDSVEHKARNRRTEFDIEEVNGARIEGYTNACAPNSARHLR